MFAGKTKIGKERWFRRDIIIVVLTKLLLLVAIKMIFFPQRLPASVAAQGVMDRVASPQAIQPQAAHLQTKKEKQ